MMKNVILILALATSLGGCSLLPASVDAFEEQAANAIVASSERTICRNIPIGTWLRLYGSHPERRKGWQALCTPAQASPAPDAATHGLLDPYTRPGRE